MTPGQIRDSLRLHKKLEVNMVIHKMLEENSHPFLQ